MASEKENAVKGECIECGKLIKMYTIKLFVIHSVMKCK